MLWQLSLEQWFVSLSCIGGIAYICGWIADRIMATAGFGAIGNWLLLLIGAYAGMYGYNLYGYQLNWYPLTTLYVAVGSAFILLISFSIGRRVSGI